MSWGGQIEMAKQNQTRALFVSDNENCSMEFVTLMRSLGHHECSAAGWADTSALMTKKN